MRGKDLFEKITDIDNDFIENTGKHNKSKNNIKWIAAVAGFVVILSVTIYSQLGNNNISPIVNGELPLLTIELNMAGGMGFEGYMAYSIDDLTNANPWNKSMNIRHLPVITNKLTYNEMQMVDAPNYTLMEDLLKDTAKSLGMDVRKLPITTDMPDEETKKIIIEKLDGEAPERYFDIGRLFIRDELYEVEVDTSYTVKVNFKQPVKLSSEYNFTHYATYDEKLKVAEYLKEKYSEFIGMKNPQINISGGDYNIYAEQSYSEYFYEKANTDADDILSYHFNNVEFHCDDKGELYIARKYYTDLSNVVGEYPIITVEEALDLLKNGNYITTVPQEFEGIEYVKKTELVYRNGPHEKVYMPYYKFYVELPDMKLDNGLNNYGAYYVPAVERQYIKNMPVWDGGFN